jgi:hypothetical protein
VVVVVLLLLLLQLPPLWRVSSPGGWMFLGGTDLEPATAAAASLLQHLNM